MNPAVISNSIFRASNTTNSLVLRFEADNPECLARMQHEVRKCLLAIQADLTLPF